MHQNYSQTAIPVGTLFSSKHPNWIKRGGIGSTKFNIPETVLGDMS
jgi:hypothetical protein